MLWIVQDIKLLFKALTNLVEKDLIFDLVTSLETSQLDILQKSI